MNKKQLIDKVKSMKFPEDSFVVFGSGVMAALGLRDVNDIDLYVSKELHAELQKNGWKKVIKGPLDEPIVYDVFEAHDHWNFSPYAPTFEEMLSRAVMIDGVPFASLDDVLKWKKASGGEKHLKDVEQIEKYIKSK